MAQSTTIPIRIPTALREYCRNVSQLSTTAPDVRSMLAELEREQPRLYPNICDETGAVRRHLNVFVNNASIRDGAGPATLLAPGDVVTILTAVSGG
jgi:molybdopterin converting factor small subunit